MSLAFVSDWLFAKKIYYNVNEPVSNNPNSVSESRRSFSERGFVPARRELV